MSFEGPFNLNHNLNITETPPHWLEKPQNPQKLFKLSVSENKASPEALSLAGCFPHYFSKQGADEKFVSVSE